MLNRDAYDRDLAALNPMDDLSCMIFDVDNFKAFNDGFGRQVGDEVLRKVGKGIGRVVKDRGKIYRYGGDEFVVLVKTQSEAMLKDIAEDILESFRSISLECVAQEITISIGIAINHQVALSKLFYSADMALYSAKAKGKNCIEFYEG